jgi:hypothetical protein
VDEVDSQQEQPLPHVVVENGRKDEYEGSGSQAYHTHLQSTLSFHLKDVVIALTQKQSGIHHL